MKLEQLRALADDFGLIDQRIAVPARMSRGAWRHAHRAGMLVSIHQGVSRVIGVAETPEQQIMAAVRAVAPRRGSDRAMAAGRTGAFLLGLDVRPDAPIHVSVNGRHHLTPLVGVAVHRPDNHLDLAVADDGGPVPRCRTGRILLDVAAWDPHLTSPVLEEMIVKRLLTLRDAERLVERHSRQGRPGLTALRTTVESWTIRERPPDSVLEARFAKLCAQFGLPTFEFQRPVGRFRTDFCRVPERVVVECDGFHGHGRRHEQVERDKERDAEMIAQGWVVLRFTWHQINRRPEWVASRIRSTLRLRATLIGGNP